MNAYWQNRLFRGGILLPGMMEGATKKNGETTTARREQGETAKVNEQTTEELDLSDPEELNLVWVN